MDSRFSTDNLNAEILSWVLIAKGDVVGHEFHGNQYTAAAEAKRLTGLAESFNLNKDRFSDLDKIKQHEQLADGHAALAEQHKAMAEKLRASLNDIDTSALDEAIKNIKNPQSSGSMPTANLASSFTVGRNGGVPLSGLAMALQGVSATPADSSARQKALDAASDVRDNTVGGLLGISQALSAVAAQSNPDNNYVAGQRVLFPTELAKAIAPQDLVGISELAERMRAQATSILSKTSGLGLQPVWALQSQDPDWGQFLFHGDNKPTLMTKDGKVLTEKDYDNARVDDESLRALYNNLTPESQKSFDDTAHSSTLEVIHPSDIGEGVSRSDLPSGTSVPTLRIPAAEAKYIGSGKPGYYPGSVGGGLSDDPEGNHPIDDPDFWQSFVKENRDSLQPETIKALNDAESYFDRAANG
jgi:hypothetical protein